MRPERVGAGLVLAGLAAAIAVVSTGGSGVAPVTTAARVVVTKAPATTPITAPPPSEPVPDALTAVEGGLSAWGEFAVSGDLKLLEPWFDPAGPQYVQLATEAKKLAVAPLGAPPYSVVMIDPTVKEDGAESRVAGRVVFSRPGEAPRSYSWVVVVRRAGDRFRVWTVNEVDAP